MPEFKNKFDSVIKRAVLNAFKSGKFNEFLFINPAFYEVKDISCLHLTWRGPVYKDMKITIDLVPAFKIDDYELPFKHLDEPCEFYVFIKTILKDDHGMFFCPVAYSDVEYKLLNRGTGDFTKWSNSCKGHANKCIVSERFPAKSTRSIRH